MKEYNNNNSLEKDGNLNMSLRNSRNLFGIYSNICFGLCVFFAISLLSQFGIVSVASAISKDVVTKGWFHAYLSDASMYGVAIWAFFFFLSKVKSQTIEKQKFGFDKITLSLLIIFFFMVFGSVVGSYANGFLQRIFNKETEDSLSAVSESMTLSVQILFFVIIAPVGEELMFRKLILDRTIVYGEKTAIVFSALSFALFHANLNQFFYALGAGLVLAYVYARSGNYFLCVTLHSVVNALFGVFIPYLGRYVLTDKSQILAVYYIELLSGLVGLICLIAIIAKRKIIIKKSKYELSVKSGYCAFINPAFILFTVFMLFISLLSYI